ncbi:MAG: hypothetical protein ACI308_01710, partial [Muribaculaceae bacterium]
SPGVLLYAPTTTQQISPNTIWRKKLGVSQYAQFVKNNSYTQMVGRVAISATSTPRDGTSPIKILS